MPYQLYEKSSLLLRIIKFEEIWGSLLHNFDLGVEIFIYNNNSSAR